MPPRQWQIETGLADWTLEKSRDRRETSTVIGETTFKYGLTAHSDIELDVTPWQRTTSRAPDSYGRAIGIGDINVLYKQELTPDLAAIQVTAMPYVKIPTAKRPLGNGKWEWGLLIPLSYAIPKSSLSIGLTPEVDWLADAGGYGYHAAMVQVAALSWQVNDKLNLSAEIWGQWDWDPAGRTRQTSADGSVAYLLSNSVQVDAGVNFGLNRATPDVELYSGISKRF